jgi:23S rRNA (cytosine1962-C5)-methyltransferase
VSDYALLDSGGMARLERFGPWVLDRPSPQAFWNPRLPRHEWEQAHARYERSSQGGGRWLESADAPEAWSCRIGDLEMELRRTGFGHVGVFAEQVPFWNWLRRAGGVWAGHIGRPPRILNLFAYTGGSSIAAAAGGAEVTHCDASRGVVQWASENAGRNDLGSGRIRWIVDDAMKFLRREARRGHTYDGIVLDPPSFGRGPKGEVWKLEDDAVPLLGAVASVLAPRPGFVLLSAHTPGLGPLALANLLRGALEQSPAANEMQFQSGEMSISPVEVDGFSLPAGTWARACHQELQP